MKEAFWGVLIVILGLFGIVVVNVFQNVTVDNDRVYYVIKESTEASLFDALDLTYYRLSGKLRIVEDKFVENLTRRFAENITPGDYIITVQDVNEMPPKVSLKVRSGITSLRGEEFGIVNRVDGILETKYPQDEIKDFVGEENDKEIYDGDICNSVINNDELECIPGDIRFDGFEDATIDNAICQDETPKQNVKRVAKYSVCDCGKWSEKEEEVYANSVKQNNEHVYTWTFTKTTELRTISESIKSRVQIQTCTTNIGIMVPNDIDKVNQNTQNIKLPYQPSSDNSKYIVCPSGGIKIPLGMSLVVHPNYIPELSINRDLEWSVDDSSILGMQSTNPVNSCILNDKGTNCFSVSSITANKVGVTNINVKTTRGQTATCKVEVYDGHINDLSCENLNLSYGGSGTMKRSYKPTNATHNNLKWSISPSAVATIVESTGAVTANAAGTATVTVKSESGKTATCTLKVNTPPSTGGSYGGGGGGGGGGSCTCRCEVPVESCSEKVINERYQCDFNYVTQKYTYACDFYCFKYTGRCVATKYCTDTFTSKVPVYCNRTRVIKTNCVTTYKTQTFSGYTVVERAVPPSTYWYSYCQTSRCSCITGSGGK